MPLSLTDIQSASAPVPASILRPKTVPKVIWHSNAPWSTTGYGVQTAIFVPRIKALGYDTAISAFWGLGGSALEWDDGIRVYPADENWGNRLLYAWAGHHGGDDPKSCLTITLMDVWVLINFEAFKDMRMACWVPVDHDPAPPGVTGFFEKSGARPIAMSQFGQRKLQEAGLDPLYVPHGVETGVYKPSGDRKLIREAMDVPGGAFLVGMVAMNKGNAPSRKAFPQAFEAFARFHKAHPDSVLYLHAEAYGIHQGVNLKKLIDAVGIPHSAVRWASQLDLEIGIPPETMAHLYSAMDVLINPSYGEGFGIPIVEAQACGTPVIVTDCTSMTELAGPGWAVGGDPWFNAKQSAFWTCPSIGGLTDALGEAYDKAEGLREKSRDFALSYDADEIAATYWKPVLKELTK